MRNPLLRSLAAIVTIICLTSIPAQAGPIAISDVVQVLSHYQNTPEVRLRSSVASNGVLPSGVKSSLQVGSMNASSIDGGTAVNPGQAEMMQGSLLAGMSLYSSDPQGVERIVTTDVDGTICDCGEIPIAGGGGFPKWPLLFLAAIPLFFINHGGDEEVCLDCTPTQTCLSCSPTTFGLPTPSPGTPTTFGLPTPSPSLTVEPRGGPPPEEVPEPASILLLASGLAALGAGARRRYLRAKLEAEIKSRKEM